jgi:hypothetical protein
MKSTAPTIDDRSPQQLLKRMRSLAPFYTPEWNVFGEREAGVAIMQIYLNMLEQVTRRFNRVLDKSFVDFLDMMGMKLSPAQSAHAGVTFTLAEGSTQNVVVPKGTLLSGQPPEGGEEQVFETENELSVLPATLEAIYSVDAVQDAICEHAPAGPIEVFSGTNKQEHSLYLGHDDLFNQEMPADITICFELTRGAAVGSELNLAWEYWNGKQWVTLCVFDRGSYDDTTYRLQNSGMMVLHKTYKAAMEKKKVSGIEARWIRCKLQNRLTAAAPPTLPEIKSIQIAVNTRNAFPPDLAFSNDIPLDLKSAINPFGKVPMLFDAFYIASDEVFSKRGATINLALTSHWSLPAGGTHDPALQPVLSWEYWNGKSWRNLAVTDNSVMFRDGGSIQFTCPDDIQMTRVNGENKFWIRVRLIDGNYGQEIVVDGNGNVTVKKGCVEYPIIESLQISYADARKPPQRCITLNSLNHEEHLSESTGLYQPFEPFKALPETHNALFLGFSGESLAGAPLRTLFDVDERPSDDEQVKMQWFSWNGSSWVQLNVTDDTENLTKAGTLEWAGNSNYKRAALFGQNLFWLKAAVVEGRYTNAPRINKIFPNTTRAVQADVVIDEVLGGSDGTANQTFSLLKQPIISQEVWVREADDPDEEERVVIVSEEGDKAIDPISDEQGKTRFWVRWHEVDDLYTSSAKSRHYTVDKRLGKITFGDGVHGMVPPVGADSIMADYRFGGGKSGNLPAGAISGLKNAIPYVSGVTNPLAADGGAETETLEQVLISAPYALKNRGRAVTAEDFEWMAKSISRKVARAKCLPNIDQDGECKPGWVTVIIVPDTNEVRPYPTQELINGVSEGLAGASPNIVSTPDHINVCRPEYVEIIVEATVVPVRVDVAATVEKGILAALNKYIHPLTGGPQATGWEFGRRICRTEIIALIEGIEYVDHVEELVMRRDGEVQEGDVELGGTSLPVSGRHIINLRFAKEGGDGTKGTPESDCRQEEVYQSCPVDYARPAVAQAPAKRAQAARMIEKSRRKAKET